MLNFILGIFCGIGLSAIAVLVGKRFGGEITKEIEYLPILEKRKMAEIISTRNMIDEILK